ncbi:MAG: threonine synthase [Lentisphaeria bacterium]|nr:threonine synthase [Lentisphaeria bacterium]
MQFTSTRRRLALDPAQVITRGISEEGGLFVPQTFPVLTDETIRKLTGMNYKDRAKTILPLFLTDFTPEEIARCVDGAYTGTFDHDDPAPLVEVAPGMNLLELWHGPTCAFKDMALQLLPYLLTTSAAKTAPDRTMVILVATSGDTGKAALDGFANVDRTRIIVFYPQDGVSPMQKLQMTTQTGNNVAVSAIFGNFDDAQTGVKNIFADPAMKDFLASKNMEFSSANSINFGRLVPQVVYYVSAYCDLLKTGRIKPGEAFNVTVPTGNFGNILAAVYAKYMGVPIAKFICASNRNQVLTDFIRTGTYDRNRPFHTTTSPSMDILISSNLERMLYHLAGNDPEFVSGLMAKLKAEGRYTIPAPLLARLQQDFYGGFCDDEGAAATIAELFREKHYLCDTHTAVAVNVYGQYVRETGDRTPCVIASTASPYKFAKAVLSAVAPKEVSGDEFSMVEKLSEVTRTPIPAPLADLKNRAVLHRSCVKQAEMADFIRGFLDRQ